MTAVDIPVYLFTGFLEAGKTSFIQETLEDSRFHTGERTLLLLCEEGETDYNPSRFAGPNVFIETLEDPEELTEETLLQWQKAYKIKRVIVEYNGMWPLQALIDALPRDWLIYQEMMFADANTILGYNANMRSLVVDKLRSCELVVFNRVGPALDTMALHKLVRGVSRRADIAYEHPDGSVQYDDIEDPLPFDVNAPVIEIADRDYALWYRDLSENMPQYQGKTVKFRGLVAEGENTPKNAFVIGRHIMTCCVEDITYGGLVCLSSAGPLPKEQSWVTLTASISIEYSSAYKRKGPVLTALSIEPAEPPEEMVATFY